MPQKSNDYQIKQLIEYLSKTLHMENDAIGRLPTRISETPIQELKQRMVKHLEDTYKQRNRLEQIILKLGEKSHYCFGLDLTQAASNTPSTIKNSFQTSAKSLDADKNILDDNNSILEETELTKIKQDYIIEYDELVAYETLIQIAEATEVVNKHDMIQLLKESKQEEESMVYWYQVHAPVILDNLWPKMINSPIKRGQTFLLNHTNSKMPLVIMYADLVGSTSMSMTLSVEDLVLLIRSFTHELSNVVERHEGYVLKYSGDAVISFFPYDANSNNNDKYQACMRSV